MKKFEIPEIEIIKLDEIVMNTLGSVGDPEEF